MERILTRPDWLDLTVPAGDIAEAHDLWVRLALGPSTMVKGGGHFSGSLQADGAGARLSYGGLGGLSGRTGLGSLRLPGAWWADQADPAGRLGLLLHLERSRPSRLDLACDFAGVTPRLDSLATAYRAGARTGRARRGRQLVDLDTGFTTLYFGAETSDKLVRVYDMRGPVRVEVQTRHERAVSLALDVVGEGLHSAWRRALVGHIDFPSEPAWQALVAS